MYRFLASFGMHGICMCVFGSLVVIGMGFSRCDSGFNFSLPFSDNHVVMGLFHFIELDCRMVLESSEVVSEKSQGIRNTLTGNGRIHGKA